MNPIEEGKPCGACGLTQGSYTPSLHHLPPGTVLKKRYLVGRVLGEGGFGITYIGCDLQLELKVAIKEYFPTDKASRMSQASLDVSSYTGAAGVNYDKGMEKFLQEARTIARMDKQPVIVNVRDFFEVNHTAYIVMEYVEGTTFKELAEQRGGRIPAGELLYLMEPLFFALKEMHANGLIHRDISPENLMIEKGEVRLLDFGCAREAADGGNTLTIALKHGYAPVEQYQSKGQGPWTDVYALSATIYYCLTGRKPPQAMDRLVEDELIPPRKLGVDMTQKQEDALLHGMAVPPKRRFQSMEEFHTALYEGFVPGVMEKDGGEAPAVTAADEETGAEDGADQTVETAGSEESAEKQSFDLPAGLKQNKLLAGGIAAALALVILLAAVLPRMLGQPMADDPGLTQTAEPSKEAESQSPSPEPTRTVSKPAVFSRGYTEEENAAVLLAQLADDERDIVTIPMGVNFNVYEPVALGKTLRVSPDSGVYFNAPLVVGEEGRLEVQGTVNGNATMRTVDGGAISVEAGGHVGTHMLWLERDEDLSCDPDGRISVFGPDSDPTKNTLNTWNQSHYLALDERALFENAVHVTTEEEFVAHCQGDTPIVINGEITLTEYRVATVPILVGEGAVFNAPCDEHRDCTLDAAGVLINRGKLQGRISLIDFSGEDRVGRLINYGSSTASLNSYMPSTIINLGDIHIQYGEMEAAALNNLGRLTVADGEFSMNGNWSCNAGTIAVEGGLFSLKNASMGWRNCGEILVVDSGKLATGGQIENSGGIIRLDTSGILENSGCINLNAGSLRAAGGCTVNNSGIIANGKDLMEFDASAIFTGAGHVIAYPGNDADTRRVGTEEELCAALDDPAVSLVVWGGPNDATIQGGTLNINKGLVFYGGLNAKLTVETGGITITGENAFLYSDRVIDLSGGALYVGDGGTAILNDEVMNRGTVTVTDGGLMYPDDLSRK